MKQPIFLKKMADARKKELIKEFKDITSALNIS
jgi:hypothetical protein